MQGDEPDSVAGDGCRPPVGGGDPAGIVAHLDGDNLAGMGLGRDAGTGAGLPGEIGQGKRGTSGTSRPWMGGRVTAAPEGITWASDVERWGTAKIESSSSCHSRGSTP